MGKTSKNVKNVYSQYNLRHSTLVSYLLDKSSITKDDLVYDIGAGRGIITHELVRRQTQVVAIENDPLLYKVLKHRFEKCKQVEVRFEDFLEHTLPTRRKYKVFANIPFIVTSDIVRKLYFGSNPPRDCYLVLQKEAADRFQGVPRETLFSLLLKPWFKTAVIHRFRRADFYPVPRVDVVFLRIIGNEPPAIPWQLSESWKDFVTYAFGRGKASLRKALDKVITYHQFKRLSIEVNFGIDAKPTELRFEQWLALFRFFTRYAGPSSKKYTHKAFLRLTEQQLLLSKQHRTHVR